MILYILIQAVIIGIAYAIGYEARYMKEIKALEEVLKEEK